MSSRKTPISQNRDVGNGEGVSHHEVKDRRFKRRVCFEGFIHAMYPPPHMTGMYPPPHMSLFEGLLDCTVVGMIGNARHVSSSS